ncbi:hypothetical protein BJX76DRAFT_348788 [Aspergillus varians]
MVGKCNLVGKTVHAIEFASASEMEHEQFLLLHVFWMVHSKGVLTNRFRQELDPFIAQAKELLGNCKPWKAYCKSFGTGRVPSSSFLNVRRFQKLVVTKTKETTNLGAFSTPIIRRSRRQGITAGVSRLRFENLNLDAPQTPQTLRTGLYNTSTPDSSSNDDLFDEDEWAEGDSVFTTSPRTPAGHVPQEMQNLRFPPTMDEEIVNISLIFPHRRGFSANFEKARFNARTDGVLEDGQENVWALIEVKPVIRDKKMDLIQIQEAAQMVAWLQNDADSSNKLRIHISQDRHEIFITVAEYDEDYLAYLRNEQHDEAKSFLTMHQQGPWDTESSSDMREVGPILLGITLYAEAQVQNSRQS